ncbi:MAG: RNA polymerase sigma factor [Solirubrobacteraceae bacterium]
MGSERALYEDFGLVYRMHLDVVLAFCVHRLRDRELAADMTAEVFAAALIGRGGYRRQRGSVGQWLLGIAAKKVVDAQRRGFVERRAQQQLGMMEIRWFESDFERVEEAGETHVQQLLRELPAEQRSAIESRVLDDHSYAHIADSAGVSEQVVRKRVSRGLSTIRRRLRSEDQT